MSIFREMYDLRVFASKYEYDQFLIKLSVALEKGWIVEIPVTIRRPVATGERWFRDNESNEVYRLGTVDSHAPSWTPVEPEDLFPSTSAETKNVQ